MARNTDKLKLYVYDTQTDGSMLFSITESMTNNFVKIDSYAKEVDTKIENLISEEDVASKDKLGLVKIGKNLSISADGTLSATATSSVDPEDLRELVEEYLSSVNGKKPGEIIVSLDPMDDVTLKLLDGSTIELDGMYASFIQNYIIPLYNSNSDRFITEEEYQEYLTKYGKCGYYVYDEVNNYLRLPTLTGMVEGSIISANAGKITEAGLPEITITGVNNHNHTYNQNDLSSSNTTVLDNVSVSAKLTGMSEIAQEMLDGTEIEVITNTTSDDVIASVNGTTTLQNTGLAGAHEHQLQNELLGKSNTVQPETMTVFYYIVLAEKIDTNVTVVTLTNALTELSHLTESVSNLKTISYDSGEYQDSENGYMVLTTGVCLQWGKLNASSNVITFQVPFVNTNYSFFINPIGSYSYTEIEKNASYININRGSNTQDCYWLALGITAEYEYEEVPEEEESPEG